MNILIDGRIWSLFSAGVGTFFTCAIMEWAKQRKNDILYIILPKGLDTRYELSSIPDNIKLLDYSKQFPERLPNIIILQLLVPYLCRKLHINMYYSPDKQSKKRTSYGPTPIIRNQKWKHITPHATARRYLQAMLPTGIYFFAERCLKTKSCK